MAYRKLSEQIKSLTNPQRSDSFVKEFKNAVREGKFEAAYLTNERFTLPKNYARRGSNETYNRSMREMIFEATSAFDRWFEEKNRELAASRRGGSIKPSIESIEAGLVDFSELAAETRRKMQRNYKKGQSLGNSRSKAKAKK